MFVLAVLFTFNSILCQKENDKIQIYNLGPAINSEGYDYAPTITPDGELLIFVSQREGSILTAEGEPSHDFWAVKIKSDKFNDFSLPFNLDSSSLRLNTPYNEGVASITADGKTLYFTACNRPNGLGSCDIFKAEWEGDRWGKPFALGRNVNTGFWESQPSISPDGKRLYFVSNRPDGGDLNIWYSDYDEEFEEWGEAKFLEIANTDEDEQSPFIAPDNITLIFSSDGREPNMGGLDFYVTRFNQEFNNWEKPAHLASPLNSSFDERFLSMPASGDIIYFASSREDIGENYGKIDLFVAKTPRMFRSIVLKVNTIDAETGKNVPSEVVIRNPAANVEFKSRTTKLDSSVEFVVTQQNFGEPEDSLKYVDFEIKSKSEKGEAKKIVRINNPKIPNPDEFRDFADKLNITLEQGEKSYEGKPKWSFKHSILSAPTHIVAFKNGEERNFEKLYFIETPMKNSIPILGYVFFNHNSYEIPKRFKLFESYGQAKNFKYSELFNQGTLYCYHHVLNIIGKRLKEYPDANIQLMGCNSGYKEEKENKELSRKRAETIANYLAETWKINRNRIIVSARNLPTKPSNPENEDGRAENRRVEIYSENQNILSPIMTNDTVFVVEPETIKFKEPAMVKFGEAYWRLKLIKDEKIIKEFNGEGTADYALEWNVKKEMFTPQKETPIYYEMEVNDKEIQKTLIGKDTIPLEIVLLSEKTREAKKIKREKYSLILFDFGSARIKNKNRRIMNMINKKINNNSEITIVGYADRSGNDEFNLRLSQKRAEAAAKKISYGDIVLEGKGEELLLYNNSFPEGRFYCRTVEIIIDNLVK